MDKALEAQDRLGMYKQPVAFGFAQIFDDKGVMAHALEGKESMGVSHFSLYRQKVACSDNQLISSIVEVLQDPQVSNPYSKKKQ